MKIGLLNLPVDNNYGGMLQRYALMKVIQDMGHDVVHLNLRFNHNRESLPFRCVRLLKRVLGRVRGKYSGALLSEYHTQKYYYETCRVTDMFYNKYIDHTRKIINKRGLRSACRSVDALVVGSDQVWRKSIALPYGISTFFGDFIDSSSHIKKVAYGVSFGTDSNELDNNEILSLAKLYETFSAVSVRESSAITLINSYGWKTPVPIHVLDPTLLLSKADYLSLVDNIHPGVEPNYSLCYILDPSEDKTMTINHLSSEKELHPVYVGLDGTLSIEYWLALFRDASYVVTDSYHGVVFSIIMRKPFKFFQNSFRGNARFTSLMNICGISDSNQIDWESVQNRIEFYREKSISFLSSALE